MDLKILFQQIQGGVVDASVGLQAAENDGPGFRPGRLHLGHKVRKDHRETGLLIWDQIKLGNLKFLDSGTQTLEKREKVRIR